MEPGQPKKNSNFTKTDLNSMPASATKFNFSGVPPRKKTNIHDRDINHVMNKITQDKTEVSSSSINSKVSVPNTFTSDFKQSYSLDSQSNAKSTLKEAKPAVHQTLKSDKEINYVNENLIAAQTIVDNEKWDKAQNHPGNHDVENWNMNNHNMAFQGNKNDLHVPNQNGHSFPTNFSTTNHNVSHDELKFEVPLAKNDISLTLNHIKIPENIARYQESDQSHGESGTKIDQLNIYNENQSTSKSPETKNGISIRQNTIESPEIIMQTQSHNHSELDNNQLNFNEFHIDNQLPLKSSHLKNDTPLMHDPLEHIQDNDYLDGLARNATTISNFYESSPENMNNHHRDSNHVHHRGDFGDRFTQSDHYFEENQCNEGLKITFQENNQMMANQISDIMVGNKIQSANLAYGHLKDLSEYWNEEEGRYYTNEEVSIWNAEYNQNGNGNSTEYLQKSQIDTVENFTVQNYSEKITHEEHISSFQSQDQLFVYESGAYSVNDDSSNRNTNGYVEIRDPNNILLNDMESREIIGAAYQNLKSLDTLASFGSHHEDIPEKINCRNCSKENGPDANFCTNCGWKLKNAVSIQSSNNATVLASQNSNSGVSLPKSDPLGRLFGHCLASFGVGGKLLFSFPEKKVIFGISAGVPTSIEKACPGPVYSKSCFNFLYEKERYAPSPLFGVKFSANEYPDKESILEELNLFDHQLEVYDPLVIALKESIKCDDGPLDLESRKILVNSFCPAIEGQSMINQIEAYLLNGSLIEACEVALAAHFWEIALIIAARAQALSSVVAAVIHNFDSSLAHELPKLSHALKFILLLFGGSNLNENELSDHLHEWQSVLGLLIMNASEQDEAAFFHFGKILENRGYLIGAYICFLLCKHETDNLLKSKLLGGDHINFPQTFFKDYTSIHLTEIYEVAKMFANQTWGSSPLPEFQTLKFIFAAYLADIGYPEKCIEYLDSILYLGNCAPNQAPCINDNCREKIDEFYKRLSPDNEQNLPIYQQHSENNNQEKYDQNGDYANQNYWTETLNDQYYDGGNVTEFNQVDCSIQPIDQSENLHQDVCDGNIVHNTEGNGDPHPRPFPLNAEETGGDLPHPFPESRETLYTHNEKHINQLPALTPENPALILPKMNTLENTSKMAPPPLSSSEPRMAVMHVEEDFGFGNTSLQKKESKSMELKMKEKDAANGSTPNLDKAKNGNEKKGGLWSSFTSMLPFRGSNKDKEETPKEMHLPQGSSFVYDPELKKWVNKKGGVIEKESSLAPPPLIPEKSAPSSSPLSNPLPHSENITLISSEKINQKKRSARSKYVDVMNPNSIAADTSSVIPQFKPYISQNSKMMIPTTMEMNQNSKSAPESKELSQTQIENSPYLHTNAGSSNILHHKAVPTNSTKDSRIIGKNAQKRVIGKQGVPPDL